MIASTRAGSNNSLMAVFPNGGENMKFLSSWTRDNLSLPIQ